MASHGPVHQEDKKQDLANEGVPTRVDCRELPLRPFYRHQWLDVKDKVNNWLEAQVIDVSGEDVFIHYKGWKDKFDEKLNVSEDSSDLDRIRAPLVQFHEHPEPYQGQLDLKLGQKLDVHDSSEKWCEGEVIDVVSDPPNRYQVKIHYTGWDSKYDEWINRDSYRLAPLHYHTETPCDVSRPALHRSNSNYRPPQDEETKFRDELKQRKNWYIKDMAGDGNCLFRSISYQVYGDSQYHGVLREKCMDYVEAERTFFINYIDGDFKEYVNRMRQNGEWGDNVEIQAMSELYGRRVEIYAYRVEPMKTYQRHLGGDNPIRISYHCRSHYNTIDYPELKQKWLTSEPGVWEDRVIASSRNRVRLRPNTRTQDEELKLAMEMSRQEFKRGDNSFDTQIQRAIQLSTGGSDLAQAMSPDDQMQMAIQASMQDSKLSELERALQASRLDAAHDSELAKVLELSKREQARAEGKNSVKDKNQNPTEASQSLESNSASAQGSGTAKQEQKNVETDDTPAWLEELVASIGLSKEKAVKAYHRFKVDSVPVETLKTNIINYCLC